MPPNALAFAYRPYVTVSSAAAVTGYSKRQLKTQSLLLDVQATPDNDPAHGNLGARVVPYDESDYGYSSSSSSDESLSTLDMPQGRACGKCHSPADSAKKSASQQRAVSKESSDRQQMALMHAKSMHARVKEAKLLVDDARYEYSCDVLFECQRGFNFLGKANFSTKLLHPMDPPPWCDPTMKLTLPNVHSFQLPDPSWQWVSPRWLIDMTMDVDEDGWQYASRFSNASWHGRNSAAKSFVRRRRWLRLRRRLRIDLPPSPQSDDYNNNSRCSSSDSSCYSAARFESSAVPTASATEECYNEGFEPTEQRHRKRSKPIAVASKIKNTVSGNYVGTKPKVSTKLKSKNLAYTLKDGKYRSHNLKGTASAAAAAAGVSTGPGDAVVPQPVIPTRRASQPVHSSTDALVKHPASSANSSAGRASLDSGFPVRAPLPLPPQPPQLQPIQQSSLAPVGQQFKAEEPLRAYSAIQLLQRRLSDTWQGKHPDLQQPAPSLLMHQISRRSSSSRSGVQSDGNSRSRSRSRSHSHSHSRHQHHHSHHHHHNYQHDKNKGALPLPTGGMSFVPTAVTLSAMPSIDGDSKSASASPTPAGYVPGVPRSYPRLCPLVSPAPTVPREADNFELPELRIVRAKQLQSLGRLLAPPPVTTSDDPTIPTAISHNDTVLVSRSLSTGRITGSQSMPGSPIGRRRAGSSLLPKIARHKSTMAVLPFPSEDYDASMAEASLDGNATSTAVTSHSVLPANMDRRDSGKSTIQTRESLPLETQTQTQTQEPEEFTTADSMATHPVVRKKPSSSSVLSSTHASVYSGDSDTAPDTPFSGQSDGDWRLRPRSSLTSLDFLTNDLPKLHPYADPYKSLRLPDAHFFTASNSRAAGGNQPTCTAEMERLAANKRRGNVKSAAGSSSTADGVVPPVTLTAVANPPVCVTTYSMVDKRLLRMAVDSLKSMISTIALDRERLDFLREGLVLGGITAATIWYCLPWLHFDFLQFDEARQRLIAMLLSYSHTCPLDAARYFDTSVESSDGLADGFKRMVTEESIMRYMTPADAKEYRSLLKKLDGEGGGGARDNSGTGGNVNSCALTLSPSQAWRFVIRPLVSQDSDLFYSDFKVMVMGVARWSLCQT
ncbi:hypothetical protein GGI07_005602 [Coemansia sp. Benny D115]|nr:hypothetical protein GGI07_005602 [Coemansia sp. Benny D115]